MDMEYFGKKWAFPFAKHRLNLFDFHVEYEGNTFEELHEKLKETGRGEGYVNDVFIFLILENQGLINLDIVQGLFKDSDWRISQHRIKRVIADQATTFVAKISEEELLTQDDQDLREAVARILQTQVIDRI